MKRQYFGTDGIRGHAGKKLLTLDFVVKLARATLLKLSAGTPAKNLHFVVGKDTRLSSDFIDMAISATLSAYGARVSRVGVVTTPGLSFLTKHYKATAGFMISASHNPYYDNGIKIFDRAGKKLADETEAEIESALDEQLPYATDGDIGKIQDAAIEPYISHLTEIIDHSPETSFLIDCANGSASRIIPVLVDKLKLRAKIVNAEPNGTNINENCGSLYIENLTDAVKTAEAQFGISFDGDADRCLIITPDAQLIDGDRIIAIFALYLKEQKLLRKNTVVVTSMSNLGLLKFLEANDIKVKITDVGDRYVLKEMLKDDLVLGGEQSGHIINRLFLDTGDGIATFLYFAKILAEKPEIVEYVLNNLCSYPQVLVNRRVKQKPKLLEIPQIKAKYEEIQAILKNDGRIVLRYSGTEPKVRVMIEGPDPQKIQYMANELADLIVSLLG